MASVGVRGTLRADSTCLVTRFKIPLHEIRMIQTAPIDFWGVNWIFECHLRVDSAPEPPNLTPGDWMCKIKPEFRSRRDTKTVSVSLSTELIPPRNVDASQICNVVHFIVTGQNFSDKGSVYWYTDPQGGLPGTWRSQSDGIKGKNISQLAGKDENYEMLGNGSSWTYIIAPESAIEVELIIPAPPRHTVEKPSLSVRQWNGYTSKLHTDCVLLSSDGKEFPAHRFILVNGSSVFAAMFEHDMQEKRSGVCQIDDIDGIILEILLEFLYTDRADRERIKNVVEEVFNVADKYAVAGLRAACETIMANSLSAKTALSYLNFAVARGLDNLKMQTIKFLNDNAAEI